MQGSVRGLSPTGFVDRVDVHYEREGNQDDCRALSTGNGSTLPKVYS